MGAKPARGHTTVTGRSSTGRHRVVGPGRTPGGLELPRLVSRLWDFSAPAESRGASLLGLRSPVAQGTPQAQPSPARHGLRRTVAPGAVSRAGRR
jgi:hypothetical protein